MNPYAIVIAAIAILAFFLQTQLPRYRLTLMLTAASVVALLNVVNPDVEARAIYSDIPWGVIVILGALNVFARIFGHTQISEHLAFATMRKSGASGVLMIVYFCGVMFVLSCVVNNLTALYLCVPMVFEAFRSLRPKRSYCLLLLALLIPVCNLGGAATPIGDFPALLLLSEEKILFVRYLLYAFPICLLLMTVVIMVMLFLRRSALRETHLREVDREVILGLAERVHTGLPINPILTVGVVVALLVMFAGWIESTVPPEIVALVGALICVSSFALNIRKTARERVATIPASKTIQAGRESSRGEAKDILDPIIDPVPLVFFFCVFFIVTSIEHSGLVEIVSGFILKMTDDPVRLSVLIVISASAFSAIFSAGPGMALAMALAGTITGRLDDPHSLYVGIALGICAGSCMFLTAATSGPILQRELDLAEIQPRDSDSPVRLNVQSYLATGLISWFIVLLASVSWTLLAVR